jgi:dihydropteroate synthase
MHWQTSRFDIDLSRPQVMAIVNLTPDSFSDGGQDASVSAVLQRCEQLIAHGADVLDLGAESSRPGAASLPQDQELARLLPVLREAVRLGVPVSVDTYKPAVMQAALDLGADIINDIWALRWQEPGGLRAEDVLTRHGRCGVCLMHMHGEPATMQVQPMQGPAMAQVLAFLNQRSHAVQAAGIAPQRLALDPGIGFGKTAAQNFELLREQAQLQSMGLPVLIGWSRKSSLAGMTVAGHSLGPQERLIPSVAAAVLAVQRGAQVLRVHDVLATVQALKLVQAAS